MQAPVSCTCLLQAIQHNRLILGFTNRRRWLQQSGLSGPVLVPQQPGLQAVVGQHMAHGMDDISDGFAGEALPCRQQPLPGLPTATVC